MTTGSSSNFSAWETQASGLSWLTVLKKRAGYREVFEGFALDTVARYDTPDVERIIASGRVIKSRPKIEAIITNAQLFRDIREEFGSLDTFFWHYVDNQPIIHAVPDYKTAACTTPISDAMTRDLKKRGFKFIGSTTLYAFMQRHGR